ncbi:hypothetical protein AKJ09_00414 [Labilithrix luteola]|uniref:Transglycosylase SLT domain-containing protein n=1 Tax=Labilithrix luteola TaxID=1391654 RepID=A0A0K1PJQ7_9BACT|nr:hypothetical protein [Labilithrix luteola]AKU93750.1 hypothetical protein AKJ09_00414 [Labilithrix luteola]
MPAAKIYGLIAFASLLSVVTVGCAAETDDEEAVGESEDHLLAGRRLSPSETAAHLRSAGFPENQIGRMVCTAKYESSFYERAQNKNTNRSVDRGLFQINSIHLGGTPGCPARGASDALWNAATNAKCAYAIFKLQGNNAWNGYKKHRSECDRYPAPSSAPVSTTADDESTATNSSSSDDVEGGCWSGTLKDMVDARTCVQSKADGVWYQCMDGGWYRGGNATTGNFGACVGSHPL